MKVHITKNSPGFWTTYAGMYEIEELREIGFSAIYRSKLAAMRAVNRRCRIQCEKWLAEGGETFFHNSNDCRALEKRLNELGFKLITTEDDPYHRIAK